MAVSRRTFLKCAAFTLGGTVLAESPFVKATTLLAGKDVRYVPSYCEICFWKCGLIARVEDGTVVKLEGHGANPQSRGKLCGRGQGGIGLLYDKDRLKTPLMRVGERGDGKYKKVSWDEAYSYIADKMNGIKETYGPEAMALFAHGSGTGYLSNFNKAFGSPNESHPSYAQCKGARDVGFTLTFGSEPASSSERVDMANSRVIALFGTHLGENMHNSHVQDFTEGLSRGAKLIVVDPRFSTAATKASMWLPIKPGTDLALILAWTNILISEDLYDKDYIEKYASGFDELRDSVKEFTPAWAAKLTDLPEEQIVEAARELGRYRPNVVVHPGRHVSWYGDDTQRSRGIAILNALLGSWGREGGLYLPPKKNLAKAGKGPDYPKPGKPSITKGKFPFAYAGVTTEVRDVTISADPYPIKGWILIGTNLMKTLPAPQKTLEAISKLDLLVSIDVMPTDTVMMSDIILPASTYLERHDDLMVVEQMEAGVAIRQPVVEPMYETKPPWLIAKELCTKLGLEQFVPYNTLEDKLKKVAASWNIDYRELSEKGYVPLANSYAPYITEGNPPEFKTDSGKIELHSLALEDAGFDPVPRFTAPEEPPAGMLRVLYGRSPVHTFSRTINNPRLWEIKKTNEVWINAEVAAGLGIKDGDAIALVNQDGVKSDPGLAKVTERIRPDCLYLIHGFGSTSKGLSRAYRNGIDDQQMITRYAVDPISGTSGMRVNFAKIVKEA